MRVEITEIFLTMVGFLFWERNQDKMSMDESIVVLYQLLDEYGIEVYNDE